MKKLSILSVIAIIFSIQLNAQTKVGTVDVEYIISNMPELEQVRTDVTSYNDGLESQSKLKINTFQTLVDSYQQNESTYTEAIKKEKQSEIIALENDIKQFQQNSNKLIQLKQDELIQPLYQIIGDALNAVSKEEKSLITISSSVLASSF
jgi:outer membrane protein